jgi:hypothetical protein
VETITWRGRRIAFRVAAPDEMGDVLSLLDEAAAYLQAQGIGGQRLEDGPTTLVSRYELDLAAG